MADEKPIIDFGTAPRDLQLLIDRLKLADGIIVKISEDALKAGRNLSAIQLPSDLAQFTAENQRLTARLQSQAATLSQLQTQYTRLTNQRQNSTQRTAEEAVNQGILNRNAMESARINSTLAGAYARLSAEQSKASRNLQDLIVRGRSATQTQREYDRELRVAQREFNTLNQRVTLADRAVGRFNSNVGNYPMQAARGIKDLIGAFGIVGGVSAIAAITKDVYEQVKSQESLDLALKQVTKTQSEYARAQQFISEQAEINGVEINTLEKAYTKFYVSASDKLSVKKIEDVFGTIVKAASTMGLTVENQERVFTSLNQMLSKGKVQAEELRQQLGDALPGAIDIMQRAYQKLHPEQKITSEQFEKLMENGKIISSEVLPEFANELERTFNLQTVKRVENLATAQNRLTNAWKEFIRELNDGNGTVSKTFAQITVGMSAMLNGLTNYLKSDSEKLIEKHAKIRTDAYKEESDALSELGNKAKEQAENRKKEIQPLFDASTKEKNALLLRNKELKESNRLRADGQIWDSEARDEYDMNQKVIKSLNIDLYDYAGRLSAINKVLRDKPKDNSKISEELSKKELKAIEDRLKALYDAQKKELELQLFKTDLTLNNEDKYYTDRLTALERDNKLRIQIAQLDYNEHFRLAKDDKNKQRVAEIDHQIAVLTIAEKYGKDRIALEKLQLKSIKETKDFDEKYNKETLESSSKKAIEMLEKQQESVKKLKEFYDELRKSTDDWLGSFSTDLFQNSGMGSLETFFDGTFKKLLGGADTTAKQFAVYFNAIAESAQEAFNLIASMSNENFNSEKERLQNQYDVSLKYAGDSTVAQKKLAEDFEKQKKDIAHREAKAKQDQAIFNIAIDTAQAVASAVAESPLTFGLPWSAFAIAMGAVQIGLVKSQKIPQYFMGGTHDGGLMMVNDGAGSNYKETIVTPDGKVMKPQGRNVIMDAPAGTEIFTNSQWNDTLTDMLQGKGISMNNQPIQRSITKEDMKGAMLEAIGSQTQHHSNFDANGATDYIISQGNITKRNSMRASGKGIRFNN
jgi:tape measure domain-containing protein